MTDILRFNFCTVHIYDIYLIVEIDEGINISTTHIDLLKNIVDTYYRNQPFVYISKRSFNYSVEPLVYFETHAIKNLKGFAVVGTEAISEGDNDLVSNFTNKPYKFFNTVQEATDWALQIIPMHGEKN
ncbi:hypothetical protein [Aegicerativicinus sediminis]|uniref:hypothetical protein n=1 Tax=Aegicerativicinus sediminis TaxID=2893202 RepID=UPI001E596B30|nr:hypothetical protein [Aegicerativicinus sediminis]